MRFSVLSIMTMTLFSGLAAAQGTPIISEFMAANTSRAPLSQGELLDKDGESSDWIEIWNPSPASVSLEGWFLTDNLANPTKWRFPAVELAPGGFLIVFASGKNERDPAEELHTNFALAAGGESVALVGPDETIVHAYADYPPQFADISYGMSSPEANLQTQTTLVPEALSQGADPSRWIAGFGLDACWI
jgi:hypothetical protein